MHCLNVCIPSFQAESEIETTEWIEAIEKAIQTGLSDREVSSDNLLLNS